MALQRRKSGIKRLILILPVLLGISLLMSSPDTSTQAVIGAPAIAPNLNSFAPESVISNNSDQDLAVGSVLDFVTPESNLERDVTLDAEAITFVFPTATPTRTPTPINIGNFVWDDRDHDGRQDAGEAGLAGVTVQLWNSTKTALLDSATTNENGNYTVVAPVPGDYRLRVLLPASSDQFSPKDGAGGDDQLDSDINPTGTNFGFTDIMSLPSNLISTTIWDAGIIKFYTPTPTRTPTPINIGNFVWNDLDEDGVQDVGEPGLVGITVQLWNSAMNDMIYSATTNENGNYTVIAPVPGDYRVRVLAPIGADFSPKYQAEEIDDSNINPNGFTDILSLPSNLISITTIDAGLINVPATNTPTKTPLITSTPTPPPTLTPSVTPQGGVELLVNGGFESKNVNDPDKPELLPWVGINLTEEKIKCNKPEKPVAYSGECAFKFTGSPAENSKIQQAIDLSGFTFADEETLDFKVQINGKGAATTGKIKVVIKYNDTTPKDKITVDLLPTSGYEAEGGLYVLASGNIKKIKIVIQHQSPDGKLYIDGISLFKLPNLALVPLP